MHPVRSNVERRASRDRRRVCADPVCCPVAGHVSVMKPLAIVGILLIVVGLAALVYQGVTYTSRETVIDIGPLEATAERQRTLPLPPVVGIVAVIAGVAFVVVSARKGG